MIAELLDLKLRVQEETRALRESNARLSAENQHFKQTADTLVSANRKRDEVLVVCSLVSTQRLRPDCSCWILLDWTA